MKFTKLNVLAALALAGLTYCSSPENRGEEGAEAEVTTENADTPQLNRIEGMSRQDFQAYAKMSDVTAVETAPAELQQHIGELTNAYLSIKDALVESQPGQAATAAEELSQKLSQFATANVAQEQAVYSGRAEKLNQDASAIANTQDLAEQRAIFVTLSKNIGELNQAYKAEGTLYVQYCPMAFNNKGAYWVSREEKIMNPYFGDMMLNCGRVDKTL